MAVNLPIQGTAADILKRAMIDVHAALKATLPARADDSDRARRAAVRIARPSEADEVAALVRDTMARPSPLKVPLDVDVGIGENWKEAKS